MRTPRDRYYERKAMGLCTKCGKNPAAPGRGMCKECAAKVRERAGAQYERRRAQGMCVACGKRPALPGMLKCEACREYARGYAKDYYHTGATCDGDCESCSFPECVVDASPKEKALSRSMAWRDGRKAMGLCVMCGKPTDGRHSRCADCLGALRKAYHERTQARKDAGLCYVCGKRPPEPGKTQCRECTKRRVRADHGRYEGRVLNGLCGNCGKAPAAEGHNLCASCLEKLHDYYVDVLRPENPVQPGRSPAPDHPWRKANRQIRRRREEDDG